MTDLRKAAEDLLEVVEAAIKAGDWKVDGACDLDLAIVRIRQALAQPEWVGLTDEELLTAYGWIPAPGAPDWILNGAKEELLGALRKVEAKLKEKNT